MLNFQNKTVPVVAGAMCVAFLDGACAVLTLKEQLGADGAEGKVFRGTTKLGKSYAVKIYHNEYRIPRSEALLRKLHLLTLAQNDFTKLRDPSFAWPLSTVHLGRKPSDLTAGNFIGFVMPLADQLYEFYDLVKKSRVHGTPTLTQRIAIGYFLAKGFATLHEGVVVETPTGSCRVMFAVGDVNDSNIRVTGSNAVFFFDCDSYIVRAGSDEFGQWTTTTDYSSPEFLAAGLNHKYMRTAEDDNFGLAVLIFRLLNNWELPYRYHGAPAKSRAALILDRRFPYAAQSKDRVIPGAEQTLAEYQSMHSRVSHLFERAFLPNLMRPKAAEWVQALQEMLMARPDLPKRKMAVPIDTSSAAPFAKPAAVSPVVPPPTPEAPAWVPWVIGALIVFVMLVVLSFGK